MKSINSKESPTRQQNKLSLKRNRISTSQSKKKRKNIFLNYLFFTNNFSNASKVIIHNN